MSPAVETIVLGSALDPEVRAWRAAVLANGGSVGNFAVQAVNRFVRGCKADGVWGSLLDVGVFAGVDNLAAALVKLKTPAGVQRVLTNVNFVAADYSPNGGLRKSSNVNARLETGFVASDFLSASGASLGIYAGNLETSGAPGFIGVADAALGTAAHTVLIQSGSRQGVLGQNYNTPANFITAAASTVAAAHEVISRAGPTSSVFYRNGAQSGVANTATATGVSAGSIGILSNRYGVGLGAYTFSGYSSMSCRAYHIGLGLTSAQVAALSTRVNDLMRAFGCNVY